MNWQRLVARGEYSEIKRLMSPLNLDSLSREWKKLKPMERAVIFKLMEPRTAMEFYRQLSFSEKYFLFGAFELGSIAPILEDLPPRTRALFHRLPDAFYGEMICCLSKP